MEFQTMLWNIEGFNNQWSDDCLHCYTYELKTEKQEIKR